MTFTIRTRGAGSLIVAEYICPEHGRFERTVDRLDSGDAPAFVFCEEWRADGENFYCMRQSPFAISAPSPKVLSVPATAAVRGGDMKDRPPGMLDTRPLAEGMPMSEWRKVQKKHQEERRHRQLIEKGLKSRKVQVG